ncbi:MAG: hypothetical protein U0X40_06015 [Ferruginibacter sp.]
MKKLFAMLAVAGALAACNGGEEKPATTDSPKVETPAVVDTAKKMVDTAAAKMDTAKKMVDTAASKMKEGADKMKEAVKH